MRDAIADLSAHIERVKGLGKLATTAAPEVARELRAEILSNVERGVGPDGRRWAPTEDGHLPLRNTASELTVAAAGPLVVARLEGVHARHHLGAVRGRIARPILPSTLTKPLVAACERAVLSAARRTMGVE